MFKRMYLEITNVCNLRCAFCPGTQRPRRFMTPEEFRQLATRLRPYGTYLMLHVMGEPLLHPRLAELLEIAGELGQVLLGQLPGRTSDQEITIFDTTGTAMQDNTTAFSIYHRALEKGLGRYFDFYSLG